MIIIRTILIIGVAWSFVSCNAQKQASANPTSSVQNIAEVIDSAVFDLNYLTGKFDPKNHPDFDTIPLKYTDQEGRYLRKDVLEAFVKMFDAALLENIKLKIKSATRNFTSQKTIWENKWTGKTLIENKLNAATEIKDDVERAKKILEYSSMPGTSRHHWGTDIDLNAFENEWFETGEGLEIYNWLKQHAHEYGFCQPYTAIGSDRESGFFLEKWHWTYVPISSKLTILAEKNLTNKHITGFLGDKTAEQLEIVKNYVLAVSPACLNIKN